QASTAIACRSEEFDRFWRQDRLIILDAFPFVLADEGHPERLPHSWEVTSDSVAARASALVGARQLVLLKSAACREETDCAAAIRCGLVDPCFERTLRSVVGCAVHLVNLREWAPGQPIGPDLRAALPVTVR